MSVQPMLETKEVETPVAQVAVPIAVVATTEETKSKYEAKACSLRHACAALLFFGVLCTRPWPSVGWPAVLGAFAVLCTSSSRLLCRARVARFLAALVAIFAAITVFHLVKSIHADKPQQIGDEVHRQCVKMPVDTFEWARSVVAEQQCMNRAIIFLARHTDVEKNLAAVEKAALLSNETTAALVDTTGTAAWPQEVACATAAHVATRASKTMMAFSAFVHLLLFISAAAVVKRVCCLRCAAYKIGLLKCKMRCGATKCGKPAAAAGVAPAAKELA